MSLNDRFWAKVKSEGECLVWSGYRSPRGYGVISSGSRSDGSRKTLRTHRVSWELHYGPIPSGMHVLHRCDNPPCVRPEHLFLGTDTENAADRHQKGRDASHVGVLNGRAKLSLDQVAEIRRRYQRGNGYQLAREFGVDHKQIYRAVRGVSFRDGYDALPGTSEGEQKEKSDGR